MNCGEDRHETLAWDPGASYSLFANRMRLVDDDGDGHPCDESEEQPPQRDGAMVERKPGLRTPGERGREVAGPVGEALRRIRRAPLAADRAAQKGGGRGKAQPATRGRT